MGKLTKGRGPIFGVCGGIANHVEADPSIIRVVVAISSVFFFWITVPAYIILGIFMPRNPNKLIVKQGKQTHELMSGSSDGNFCPECGESNEEKGKFCRSCGGKL